MLRLSSSSSSPLPPPPTVSLTNCKRSNVSKHFTKLKKFMHPINAFIVGYFNESVIHGIKYVVKSGLTIIERFIWFSLVTISMYFSIKIGLQSVDKYYTKSTVLGLERNYYYWNTTMPSVTICPLARLNKRLFHDYIR
uniref:Uncharacterized protein n=1 Tax=Glossina brevipalpis TaxID=37001 RepID=A0A1A9WKE9_9MUSC